LKHAIQYYSGDSVDLEFHAGKHTYHVDGAYVPSVTTILDVISKPALMPWAAAEGARWFKSNTAMVPDQEERDAYPAFADGMSIDDMFDGIKGAFRKKSGDARDIGSIVHRWCEQVINWKLGNGDLPDIPKEPSAAKSIEGFQDWVSKNEIDWVSSEEKIYNRQHNYAGTVDAVAYINDVFCVVDFKTSSGIWDEYFLQVAAYAQAISDVYGDAVESAWILRFDKKTGKFEAKQSSDIKQDFRAFLGAMTLHRRLKELRELRGYGRRNV